MEALPGLWSLSPIAALIGVLVLAYWLLATGRLVPKASHDREISIYENLSRVDRETIKVQREQITSLLEVGRTVEALIKSAGPDITGGA